MFVWADRLKETTNSSGTGPLLLLGAAPTHFAFSSKLSDQDTCEYTVADQANGPNVEIGLGRYNAGTNTLSRLQVYASSNGGALVAFTSATKEVFLDLPAYRIVAEMGSVTPATLAANANDYTPGVGGMQRWSSTLPVNITGMVAGIAGETRRLWNIGTQTITLTNLDGASTAANQWLTSSGISLALLANCTAMATYDGVTNKWRVSLGPIGGNSIAPVGQIPYSDGAGGFRYDATLNFVPPGSPSVFSAEDMLGIGHISVGSEARIDNPSPIPFLSGEIFTSIIMMADAVDGATGAPPTTTATGIANHIDYDLIQNAPYPYFAYDGRLISRAGNTFNQGTVRLQNLQFINLAAGNFSEALGIAITMSQDTISASSDITSMKAIDITMSVGFAGTVGPAVGLNFNAFSTGTSTVFSSWKPISISAPAGLPSTFVATAINLGNWTPASTGSANSKAAFTSGGVWDLAAGISYDSPILHLRRPTSGTVVTTQMMVEMVNNLNTVVAGFQYDWQFMPVHRTDTQTAGNEGIYFSSTQGFLAYRDSGGTIHSLFGAVASVASSNTSLTISPATGAVDAILNVAHANTWTALQSFTLASPTGPWGTGTSQNERFGSGSGRDAGTGDESVAFGFQCLKSITSGGNNVGIGGRAGTAITTGTDNVAIGRIALFVGTAVSNDVAIGSGALQNCTGNNNLGIGTTALNACTSGNSNIGVGVQAMNNLTTGSSNICIGQASALGVTSANNNIIIGMGAGTTLNGGQNTLIGDTADVTGSGNNFGIALGTGAVCADSEFAISPRIQNTRWYTFSSTNARRATADLVQTAVDNTDATRMYRFVLNAWDTSAREVLRGEASGSAPMVGFLGAASVVRQNITGVRTGTLAQLQTVVANLLTGLANLGLIQDSTT